MTNILKTQHPPPPPPSISLLFICDNTCIIFSISNASDISNRPMIDIFMSGIIQDLIIYSSTCVILQLFLQLQFVSCVNVNTRTSSLELHLLLIYFILHFLERQNKNWHNLGKIRISGFTYECVKFIKTRHRILAISLRVGGVGGDQLKLELA